MTALRAVHGQALFDAFESDFTVVPSQIVARECLAILTTPLLVLFLSAIKQRGEAWASTLLDQLTERFGWEALAVWSVASTRIRPRPSCISWRRPPAFPYRWAIYCSTRTTARGNWNVGCCI